MKFLVFSDSHNYTNAMDIAIDRHNDIKRIIHCGDMADDVEYLNHVYCTSHSICAVCGNNDHSSPDPFFRIMKLGKQNIYLTHGHIEHVKQSLYTIKEKAKINCCSICVFGHTHKQFYDENDGFYLLNPGSIGYSRQEYAIIEVENNNVNVKLLKI